METQTENINNNNNMQFCNDCGFSYSRKANACPKCGSPSPLAISEGGGKSRLTYVLLALFFGAFGIHNFYSGHTGKGITKLLLLFPGCCLIIPPIISGIWSLIEMFTVKTDVNGVPFK